MNNNFKKIAFGDSLKMRFSVVRKVLYTFLHHKVFIFFLVLCLLPLKLPAADQSSFGDSNVAISMDCQDADLKAVVKTLSKLSGLNFIASEAVQDRKITLFLDKVPIKEVMDKLFKANNLTYELDEQAKIFIVKDWGKPEIETITKVYYLKYRSVPSARLEKEKTNLLTGAATTADIVTSIKQILSSTGKIAEDTRTNSLIITDIPSRFPEIERIITSLDIPQSQVMLEVEMLDVSKNTVDKMGFEFGNNPLSLLIGRAGGAGNRIRAFIGDVTSKAPQAFTSAATGVVAIGGTYAKTLDFLRTQTDTKYLARPRLLTLNNETAEISITKDEVVGRKDTVTTGTTTTTASEFERSTGLKLTPEGTGIFLRVTPQINMDTNEITMLINPKSSSTSTSPLSITTATSTQGANLQSDVEVRATKSIVKVRDGETIVLGGLIHHEKNIIIKKLPILGDIPFLGALFRHKNITKDLERELIVFITPHIVKDTNIKVAQAKKTSLLTREQPTDLVTERQLSIEATLNSFEKVKQEFH